MPDQKPSTIERVNARARAETRRSDGTASTKLRHQIKLDEQAKDEYLRLLAKVWTPELALKACGSTRSTLLTWRESDAAFLVREQHVRDGIADHLEAEAVRRAFRGIRRPVYQGGLLAGHVTEYSDPLLIFLLKALRPERFRERTEVVTAPIVKLVSGFDPEQVL
jgi:hypothetical protein